jgi:hypothetical protein
MMKARLVDKEGAQTIVFGLTYQHVEKLKQNNPIYTCLHELEIDAHAVITAIQSNGAFVLPEEIEQGTLVFMYDAAGLDAMVRDNTVGIIEVNEARFKGRVLLFSARDDHTMAEMFKEKFKGGTWKGTTCPICRSACREDGTCSCPTTVH